MANLTREQVKQIILKAPQGTSPAGVVAALRKKGHILEGFEESQPQGRTGFSGIAAGAAKGFLGARRSEAGILEKVGQKIPSSPVTDQLKVGIRGFTGLFKTVPEKIEQAKGLETGALTTPVGRTEEMSALGETILEFFAPVGFGAKAGIAGIKTSRSKSVLKNVLKNITEPITKKVKQKALQEGRVERGKKLLGLFKRPDKILPATKTRQAAQTIINEIPNVGRLNDAQVLVQAQQKIARIGGELAPKLKEIPIDVEKTGSIVDKYSGLRKGLTDEAFDASEITAINKVSKTFEEILVNAIDAKNLDDVWKLRIKFDQKMGSAVKQATVNSPVGKQAAKDAWLGYRQLLNSFIDSTADDIADFTTRAEFNKMSDLYTAIGNITARADFDKTGSAKGIKTLLRILAGGGAFAAGASIID